PPIVPTAPCCLSASARLGPSVSLVWNDLSDNETGFRVERKVGAGSYSTLATKGINVTSHSDASLAANTYTYRVIALGTPNSAPSNEVVAVMRGMEADAYVRGGTNGTLNYGGATVLEAKLNTTPPENNRESFVRFTLTDVRTTVTSAKLRIFGNANTAAKTIAVSGVSSVTWVEGTGTGQTATGGSITFNTKPAIGSQITSQSVGITAGFWEFDITSYVQAQKTAGASKISLSFTQTTNSTNGQTSFSSKEATTAINRPLVIISSK
ncbi:MAG TPA: DNRLRE domain-containing protein, partial [Polyangia bacterium]|nr:DNRLRE domain-containing protein [Polyangia bacterium]